MLFYHLLVTSTGQTCQTHDAIQHIAGEFWSRWRNEFLQSLQIQQKKNTKKRDFEVGDIVLLKEDLGRNKWPMARAVKMEPDSNGTVPSVQLRTVDSLNNQKLLRRPINKIVLLVKNSIPKWGDQQRSRWYDHLRGAICRSSQKETFNKQTNKQKKNPAE